MSCPDRFIFFLGQWDMGQNWDGWDKRDNILDMVGQWDNRC
jgi:hypothetical protein